MVKAVCLQSGHVFPPSPTPYMRVSKLSCCRQMLGPQIYNEAQRSQGKGGSPLPWESWSAQAARLPPVRM